MTRAIAYAGFACAVLAFAVAMCAGVTHAQPLTRVYLPAVAREVYAMSAEYTPAQPVPTVTPEVQP